MIKIFINDQYIILYFLEVQKLSFFSLVFVSVNLIQVLQQNAIHTKQATCINYTMQNKGRMLKDKMAEKVNLNLIEFMNNCCLPGGSFV